MCDDSRTSTAPGLDAPKQRLTVRKGSTRRSWLALVRPSLLAIFPALLAACAPPPAPPPIAAAAADLPVTITSPACPSYPIPECGDWLTLESSTSTSATIKVELHKTGRIVGYFYGLAPLQVSAEVFGKPRGGPIDHWLITGLGPGPEWTFKVSEIGKDPRGCPVLLACGSVSFELSPFDEAK
jgi:hypothetical protein